jgi:ubiquinone/menaquinone biosynthesis C-methylase UbiE
MITCVCPWWMGYLLINPVRKYFQNPEILFNDYVKPGMKIIDYGSAMGYFSLPLAKMTGETGKVYCFDIQHQMLAKLMKRANKARLEKIIEPYLLNDNTDPGYLKDSIDFALLFAVAHEVPDKKELFRFLTDKVKSGGLLYFAEPKGHVQLTDFKRSLEIAIEAGFKIKAELKVYKSHACLLIKS